MTYLVPLSNKNHIIIAYTVLDHDDFEIINQYKWHLRKFGHGEYAARNSPNPCTHIIYLSRFLMDLEVGNPLQVDHINGNWLDNRRNNLRIVTRSQNGQNRRGATRKSKSGVRGVSFDKRYKNPWTAQADISGKHYCIGHYPTIDEAKYAVHIFRQKWMPFSAMDQNVRS